MRSRTVGTGALGHRAHLRKKKQSATPQTRRAHSLCLDLTIKSQSKSGQPWCQVQGSVDTKPFLQYDSDRNKVKPLGFLGKEVNDTKVWTELSQTLAEAGKELKMVLPFIKLDKKEMRESSFKCHQSFFWKSVNTASAVAPDDSILRSPSLMSQRD
ncbi:hypothetical protein MJT46_008727 [Ovis ammon polii x Ovis aries]|nr:hypothetical protein MJT46_008727 [Ovis ammon polii x Ovis aries]